MANLYNVPSLHTRHTVWPTCTMYPPLTPGTVYGPHVHSLDAMSFTHYGVGEYVVSITSPGFEIQGRTEAIYGGGSGNPQTSFAAFAIRKPTVPGNEIGEIRLLPDSNDVGE